METVHETHTPNTPQSVTVRITTDMRTFNTPNAPVANATGLILSNTTGTSINALTVHTVTSAGSMMYNIG